MNFIKKYRILVIIAEGIACFLIAYLLDEFSFRQLKESAPFLNVSVMMKTMHYIMLFVFIILASATVLNAIYIAKTGRRNILADRKKYGKTVFDLFQFYQDADKTKLNIKSFPVSTWKDEDGLMLAELDGRLIYRKSTEEFNAAIVSPPGGGKTSGSINPTACRYNASIGGGGVLALDIKGDILAFTTSRGRKNIKIFDASNPSKSYHYDPLASIRSMSEREQRQAIKSMAFTLIPEENSENGKFFVDGARTLFRGTLIYMLHQMPNLSFPELIDRLLLSDVFSVVKEIKNSTCIEAQKLTNQFFGQNERNIAGIGGHLAGILEQYSDYAEVLDGKGACIHPSDLEHGWDIYIEIPQPQKEVLMPIASLLIQDIMQFFRSRADKSVNPTITPIILILDEFPALRMDYSIISEALSTLRSKRVNILLAFQSLAQLEKLYGETGARSLLDCITTYSLIGAIDTKSRDWMSKLVGRKKELKLTESTGEKTSHSTTEVWEEIIRPEEFGSLGADTVIYINGEYIRAKKIRSWED